MTPLPSRDDINVFDSLDERTACKHFFGKSLEGAEELFRESSFYYQGDLMWMGPVAFRFYVQALIRYIQSDFAAGDSDMINCYAGLLEFWLTYEAHELIPVASQLAASCNYIVGHVDKFDVETAISGDLCGRFTRLKERLVVLSAG